ncbi:bifunctional phosphoglucose/phosphomannose isomerase [Dehalobacterium formicoaceticum]|uniref:Bifunctional phosphoglucose/phosphomannose isomerase n=1 Tax=Dehalobacterium formicoaceticum TaxID=51515 RepID=A0ABT1Y3A7_9FIRM|nr:bifunctional phosphoglucose/phosphomannose isomerase [Dehalobacterium formicoaceticum]MCR6545359.1 bifunctional phosphoglucose/phosphomannose isomerase [Dehalobacterium formicoaceticum]
MHHEINLDKLDQLKKGDPENMLEALSGLPTQCQDAMQRARAVNISFAADFKNILVTGLGGSAIGGDFLRVYGYRKCTLPILVNRDYNLPSFVNEQTLVLAVSYSGNTEETLSAYEEAKLKKAPIVALTSGGQLAERAKKDGIPLILIPSGLQPRAATGYLFLPLLVVLEKLSLLSDIAAEIEETIAGLADLSKAISAQVPTENNPAKQLALRFYNKIPVIWGVAGTTETVAMRWKGQINENSKALAYFNVLPELNHNEIVGTEVPEKFLRELEVVFLRTEDDHPRVQKRFDITKEIIGERVGGISEVWGDGKNPLARMFALTYLGDCTSAYLALLYGIDPSPVKLITLLKNKLAELPEA